MSVLLGARDQMKGDVAAKRLLDEGMDVRCLKLDVSDSSNIESATRQIAESYGRLDVLVNNAAVLNDIGVKPSATEEKILRQNFDVNFFGPYMLTRNLVPLLRKSEGARVLNLATQVGTFQNICDPDSPLKDDVCPAYQASKIALNAITALFAKELRDDGIKVNSVCPGWVMTDMGHEDLPDYGDSVRPMSAREAVGKLVYLLQLPIDGPTGGFFSEGNSVRW